MSENVAKIETYHLFFEQKLAIRLASFSARHSSNSPSSTLITVVLASLRQHRIPRNSLSSFWMCAGIISQQYPEHIIQGADRAAEQVAAMQVFYDLAAEMPNHNHLRQRSISEMKKALGKQQDLELDRAEEKLLRALVTISIRLL